MSENPYNPLDKINLAKSIGGELLARDVEELALADQIKGAGVYAIYYVGHFPAYRAITEKILAGNSTAPSM